MADLYEYYRSIFHLNELVYWITRFDFDVCSYRGVY